MTNTHRLSHLRKDKVMTVRDLIKQLEAYNPNYPIVFYGCDESQDELYQARLESLHQHPDHGSCGQVELTLELKGYFQEVLNESNSKNGGK